MCGGYTRPSCGRSSKRWAKARGSHRANYGEESRLNVLRGPAPRLCRNRPGRQRCGSNVDNAHAESERRRNVQHHKRRHRRNDKRPHGDGQLDQHPRFHQAAADTKQAEIEYRQCQYAIPPVELGRKGEYEPQAVIGPFRAVRRRSCFGCSSGVKENESTVAPSLSDSAVWGGARQNSCRAKTSRQTWLPPMRTDLRRAPSCLMKEDVDGADR